MILIKKTDGDLLFEASEAYNKDKKNHKPLYLNVDFDMKKYVGNLNVKIWMYPTLPSLQFMIGILEYSENLIEKVSFNFVFRIRD